jgi:hypothetical protein
MKEKGNKRIYDHPLDEQGEHAAIVERTVLVDSLKIKYFLLLHSIANTKTRLDLYGSISSVKQKASRFKRRST